MPIKVHRFPIPPDVQRDITANLERGREWAQPPVHPIRFRLKTRWHIVTLRSWRTWVDVWRNLWYLAKGRSTQGDDQ